MPSSDKFDFSHLSVAERILLVEQLWDSIAADAQAEREALQLTDGQRAEIESRMRAMDAGEEAEVPWEEVRKDFTS
jgi:putative addiction module component (TIGR02574 family)